MPNGPGHQVLKMEGQERGRKKGGQERDEQGVLMCAIIPGSLGLAVRGAGGREGKGGGMQQDEQCA